MTPYPIEILGAGPVAAALPMGAELVHANPGQLAAHLSIAPHLRKQAKVTVITRFGRSKLASGGCKDVAFVIHLQDATVQEQRSLSSAEIDAMLDLLDLQGRDPATRVSWATRGGGCATEHAGACCQQDADAKADGMAGYGCATAMPIAAPLKKASCCGQVA